MAEVDLNESNSSALIGTAVILLILTWISVLLRTYVRAILSKAFQNDDWFMLVAQVNFTVSCALIFVSVHFGNGRHNKALDQATEIQALKFQALATATYIANMMFVKQSIGIFLLRIAIQKRYKYTIWASLVVITLWSLALFFWDVFQCNPVEKQWDFTIPTGHCVSADEVVTAAYALSVMTIVTDWLYALLPIPMVWNVKMTKQAKATVMAILGLGIFASIATLIRLKFLADLTDTEDILYAMVWSLIEPGVAIMASSLVTLRPLLRAWRLKGFESTENSKRTGPSAYGYGSSRKGGSQTGAMPGFGHKDDVELGHTKTGAVITIKSKPMAPISEVQYGRYGERLASVDDTKVDGRERVAAVDITDHSQHVRRMTPEDRRKGIGSETRSSEMYTIEGPAMSPGERNFNRDRRARTAWLSEQDSPNASSLNLAEPTPQHIDEAVGLGSPRELRHHR